MKKYLFPNFKWHSWLLALIIIGGALCGAIAAYILDPVTCSELGQGLAALSPNADGRELYFNILKANSSELLKIYFFGLCLPGVLLLIGYLFFKSFSLGFLALFILRANPWPSFSAAIGAVLVPQILFFPLLVAAASLMFQMSLLIFYLNKQELLKEILAKSAIMMIILLICALVSLISSGLVIKLF